jgi:hypothetical protein
MRRDKLSISQQQNQVPPVPPTIWYQLPESHRHQLAHLVAQLMQRARAAKLDKERNHEH